jgi:DNA-binding transcriptional ArsR family regulator
LSVLETGHINDDYDDAMADDRCDLLCLDLPRAEQLRLARPAREITERAADAAAALGDATRLEIAAALGRAGELCVCDLGWITERSQNLVSHHLRALRRAGLVTSRRDGKMVMYQLTETGRRLLDAVISDLSEVPA